MNAKTRQELRQIKWAVVTKPYFVVDDEQTIRIQTHGRGDSQDRREFPRHRSDWATKSCSCNSVRRLAFMDLVR